MAPIDPTAVVVASGSGLVSIALWMGVLLVLVGMATAVGLVLLSARNGRLTRSRDGRSGPKDPGTVAPPAPAYGVAAGSLDVGTRESGGTSGFSHEVVGTRGEDRVIEVSDGDRSVRFLVPRSPDDGGIAPASSRDRRHDEAWLEAAREYVREWVGSGDLERSATELTESR